MEFQSLFPLLHSHDVARTAAFYRDLLGFTQKFRWPPPGEGDETYVQLALGDASLGIGSYFAAERLQGRQLARSPFELCVYTDNTDEAVAQLTRSGAPTILPPTDKPWGERIVLVGDPEGNPLHVAAPSKDASSMMRPTAEKIVAASPCAASAQVTR